MRTEDSGRLWESLTAETGDGGLVRRRLHPDSGRDLFAVVDLTDRTRSLWFDRAWDGGPAPRTPQSRVLRTGATVSGNRLRLEVSLTDPAFADAFTTLTADIATVTAAAATDTAATTAMIGRLEHWQALLERLRDTGIGTLYRRGLFGELHVLNTYLLPRLSADTAVAAWTGPLAANQDFQLPGCAIEVKTTAGQQPQALVVANEREFDDTGTGRLFLLHLSLDERRGGAGTSLNGAVDAVTDHLSDHPAALGDLRDRLTRVGYLQHQRHLYDEPRYEIRARSHYRVDGDFPRLVEARLPPGVGAVRYSVSLTACEAYRVPATELTAAIAPDTVHGSADGSEHP